MAVADIVAEGLDIHGMISSKTARDAMICSALESTGLDAETRFRYAHEFSGGQRQRIAIARTLVLKPELLILDEPSSALDSSVQKQLLELLCRLQEERNMAYIFISHDLRAVKAMADQVLVMKNGRVLSQGPVSVLDSLQMDNHRYCLK